MMSIIYGFHLLLQLILFPLRELNYYCIEWSKDFIFYIKRKCKRKIPYNKIKEKFQNKKWIEKQLIKSIRTLDWYYNTFIFECSRFFRMDDEALENQKIYKRETKKLQMKIDKYIQILLKT